MRAVDKAYHAVRDGIIEGRFAPAKRITEQEVAAAADVSRTPVREALRRLHAEGLVDFTPHQGAVVTDWATADADEIFVLRSLLESYGAELAATRATPAQRAELRELAQRQLAESVACTPGHIERITSLNNRFHRQLQEAASSPRLSRALTALLEAPLIMKSFLTYTPDDLQRSATHHVELVRALEAGDGAWAASVMRSHVLAARSTLKRRTRVAP